MKKSVFFICLLFAFNTYAYNVRLFFTNNTPEKFKPLAVINYNQNGIPYEKYIEPEVPVIEAFAQNVKIDKDRTGIDNYFLVWFELNDEQNHYKDACLDSYVAITKSSDIYFTLWRDTEAPYQYLCKYKIIPQ
ncbi:MAG: hypothetical protein Q8M03_09010 [Legionella sp.]|nr:hypothetical protein [Legionella sp.]